MTLFRMVELEEGMPVQFVGNYVLRANEPPKYGFIEVDEHELRAETFEKIANFALEAIVTDGMHHKIWYLERVLEEAGAPVERWREAHEWEEGIAP